MMANEEAQKNGPGKQKVYRGREELLELVQKYWKDLVFFTAKVEFPLITYPQTEQILESKALYGVTKEQVLAVVGIRNAWERVREPGEARKLDAGETMHVHALVMGRFPESEPGRIRRSPVRISGTKYVPPPVSTSDLSFLLFEAGEREDKLEAGAELFARLMKGQYFTDGNKRTATVLANKYLIDAGVGVLDPFNGPREQEFRDRLLDYYDDESKLQDFVSFITEKCVYNTLDKKLAKELESSKSQEFGSER